MNSGKRFSPFQERDCGTGSSLNSQPLFGSCPGSHGPLRERMKSSSHKVDHLDQNLSNSNNKNMYIKRPRFSLQSHEIRCSPPHDMTATPASERYSLGCLVELITSYSSERSRSRCIWWKFQGHHWNYGGDESLDIWITMNEIERTKNNDEGMVIIG